MRWLLGAFCLFMVGCAEQGAGDKYISDSSACAIDGPTSNSKFSANSPIAFSGWFYDDNENTVPEHVFIKLTTFDQQVVYQADAQRFNRPDVAKAIHAGLEMAGFNHTIPAKALKPGNYLVVVTQETERIFEECNKQPFKLVIE